MMRERKVCFFDLGEKMEFEQVAVVDDVAGERG
jgi:hypothetical protein